MKLSKVVERIQAHLDRIAHLPGRNENYVNAEGQRRRSRNIRDPVVCLGADGHGVVINYAPFRDGGRQLTDAAARDYLAWLDQGGAGTHWDLEAARTHYARASGNAVPTSTEAAQDDVVSSPDAALFLAPRILGKAEVDSSILSGGTMNTTT